MHRLHALVDRVGSAWRSGRRGKFAVGCGSLVALWLFCSVCSAILRLSPDSQRAIANPTATTSAALAIPPAAPTTRPTDLPPRTSSPTSAPPTTVPTVAAARPTATTAPTRPPAVPATATSVPPSPAPIPSTATPEGQGWPAGTIRATLTSVVDGDTIKVSVGGRAETIRLIGIDTPEIVDPRVGVQCFAREASNYAKEMLRPDAVLGLEADPTQGERDKYDRLLRYIWLEDGTFFNLQAIAAGYAHEYTYDLPYKYRDQFKAAEAAAREAEIGLWSPATCGGNTEQLAVAPAPPAAPAQPGAGAVAPAPPPQAPQPPAPVAAGEALSISVANPPNAPEYATVTNTGSEPVTLGGWRILSYSTQCTLQAEQTFTFPGGYTLAPGASVNVYSGYGSSPPADGFKFNPQNIWANEADRAELVRPDGSVVARYGYGRCR